jgi:NADH-quinone oxidoreductase chain G
MTEQMVCLTIDGRLVRCRAGQTVYEAATSAGIHIPTFCHHEKLVPVGACRMCLVEIEGARGLQTSCTTPVREGMVVRVHDSPRAVKARQANIEFLLTHHPLDCPVCDKGGECPLQDQAMQDGPGSSRFIEEKRHKNKRYPLSDFVVLDQERCVLCWRCIRFLDEWADDHDLDLFGRGSATRIETFPSYALRSKWQGNTIDLCPVGALASRVFRFEARVWELTNTPSICPLCAVGCNIVVGVKNNEVRRITPRENPEVNDAWICDRGRFVHGYVDHLDRLTAPLIRRDGRLERATWDEALDLIVQRLREEIRDAGSSAVAGLGSPRTTNEADYLFQRFFRAVIGNNNVDHLRRMPRGVRPLASLPDLEHRDVILLLGCDPSTEVPLVELWIKKAVLRHGATVIPAHPRRIEMSRYAGPWLAYRPGTEVVLLHGLARVALDAGLDEGRLRASRITNPSDFREWLKAYTPEQVAHLTGVAPDALREAGQMLAHARRPAILFGPGWVNHSTRGGSSGLGFGPTQEGKLQAASNLALLLGQGEASFLAGDNNTLGAREMGLVPDRFPGDQLYSDDKIRNRLASFWTGKLSQLAGLDVEGMMAAAAEGKLRALWIMGANPAIERAGWGEALAQIPFLVVQELFLTQTASLADVVLPAASFAETDGTYINLTGRLQVLRAAKRPPGQAQPDWWIITELARRLVDPKRRGAWDFSGPDSILSEIVKVGSARGVLGSARGVLGSQGLDEQQAEGKGWLPPDQKQTARRAFARIELEPPALDADWPLVLLTGRLFYDRGTLQRRSERVLDATPDPFVLIHPADAEAIGVVDGDTVTVVSAGGRLLSQPQLELIAQVSDEIVAGVVFVPLNLSDPPVGVLLADDCPSPRVRVVKGTVTEGNLAGG